MLNIQESGLVLLSSIQQTTQILILIFHDVLSRKRRDRNIMERNSWIRLEQSQMLECLLPDLV